MHFLRVTVITVMLACGLLTPGAMAAGSVKTPLPVVIDVRTEQEWKAGHLEGAVLIPHEQISEGITKVTSDRKAKIFLYCRSGRRSSIAQENLEKNGYQNVINLGSLENASRELGRPIVK